jgi:hypothetical protein
MIIANGTAAAQVGQQHFELDTLLAQPAVERLAARLVLIGQLRHVEEGRVGGKDPRAVVGDDEAVGQVALILAGQDLQQGA